jgi:hypothetical protein
VAQEVEKLEEENEEDIINFEIEDKSHWLNKLLNKIL